MALKLNKTIKTHIADMAIRKKFKAEFDAKMAALSDEAYNVLYAKYHNEDFEVLPERAKVLIREARIVDMRNGFKMDYNANRVYGHAGYGLDIAFQTNHDIGEIKLTKPVYAPSHYGRASSLEELDPSLNKLREFLKTVSEARDTLINAMTHYKSTDKMFKELPWSEEFYPEAEKKPTCNIVPVSTIAAANDIMGTGKE